MDFEFAKILFHWLQEQDGMRDSCHELTPGAIENMYPTKMDIQHRNWIHDPAHKLVLSACSSVPSTSCNLQGQGALMLLTSMPTSWTCSCSRTWALVVFCPSMSAEIRMDDPSLGGLESYALPDPVLTWYQSFYDDYMALPRLHRQVCR